MQIKNKFEETKLIVVTRADIPDGYVVVQSTHSIADFAFEFPEEFRKWKTESNSIICLQVKDEKDLLKLFDKYSSRTQAVKFFEPDVDQYTSICLYGTPEIRKKLAHLPLALKNKKKDDYVIQCI